MVTDPTDLLSDIDVWTKVESLFNSHGKEHPEIYLVGLSPDELTNCLIYLMESSRSVLSKFTIPGTEIPVHMASPCSAVEAIRRETVMAAFWLDIHGLPSLAVFVDEPSLLSVSYARGSWTAQSVLGFFDLLYTLNAIAPGAEICPDAYCYTVEEEARFTDVWSQYLDAL